MNSQLSAALGLVMAASLALAMPQNFGGSVSTNTNSVNMPPWIPTPGDNCETSASCQQCFNADENSDNPPGCDACDTCYDSLCSRAAASPTGTNAQIHQDCTAAEQCDQAYTSDAQWDICFCQKAPNNPNCRK